MGSGKKLINYAPQSKPVSTAFLNRIGKLKMFPLESEKEFNANVRITSRENIIEL